MVHVTNASFILIITSSFMVFSLILGPDPPSLTIAQTDSDDIEALIDQGNTLLDIGQYDKAITYYDKVLAIDPNDVDAL